MNRASTEPIGQSILTSIRRELRGGGWGWVFLVKLRLKLLQRKELFALKKLRLRRFAHICARLEEPSLKELPDGLRAESVIYLIMPETGIIQRKQFSRGRQQDSPELFAVPNQPSGEDNRNCSGFSPSFWLAALPV